MKKIRGNQVRPGNVILLDGKLFVVTKAQHTQPGKGGAYMQVELKGVKDGLKRRDRFQSSAEIEQAFIEEVTLQFLYMDQGKVVLMNKETFDQVSIDVDCLSASSDFLKDDMEVVVGFYDGEAISASLPSQVVLEVTQADPVTKGQTAASSYKPAQLENGMRVMVPPHIVEGDKVVVSTAECEYLERFKG
ncbi:elongation factor P [Candidatus Hydrogenosomobacter endosymbioticus]|nr:elongation factor P [Candidatus Hydrogenosomobacter endosymbioticus]